MTELRPLTRPRLGLWLFGDTEPKEIEAVHSRSIGVRIKVVRVRFRAWRMEREWARKHGGIPHELAIDFALWHLSNVSPRRSGEVYDFTFFGLGGRLPRRKRLSEWATAYTICNPVGRA